MKNAIELLRAVGVYESWLKGQPRKRALPKGRFTIAQRAKDCAFVNFSVVEDFDDLNRPHAYIMAQVICTPPKGSGTVHKVEARLYNPFGKTSPTWVSCGCGNFRYTWEEALVPTHSSSDRYVGGPNKHVRNPRNIPALCKHLVRVLTYATRSAKVRKVLFQTPTLKQLGLRKPVMKQRGIPQSYPEKGRPIVDRPVHLRSKGRPKK
jgi:hypothetical protein